MNKCCQKWYKKIPNMKCCPICGMNSIYIVPPRFFKLFIAYPKEEYTIEKAWQDNLTMIQRVNDLVNLLREKNIITEKDNE